MTSEDARPDGPIDSLMNAGPANAGPGMMRIQDSPQRVSGMKVPTGWKLPGKPADLDEFADDTWRQTGFLCGEELRLITTGLDLQARIVGAGYTPSARNMTMAAFASLWSRAFLSTSDAVALIRRGGYQSALPLLRQAIEFIGAQRGVGDEMDEWRRFTHEAYGRHEATRATDVGLGSYFSGESIAADEHLRLIYKAASDFGRPNFGPTAVLVANEASHERYPLVFADQAFHLGWAQLLLGWALRLNVAQLHLALHLGQYFPASEEVRAEAAAHARTVEEFLDRPERCRVEPWEDGEGRRRHLIVEFKRRPADASQRLLF